MFNNYIFLDRDGTLIKYVPYLTSVAQVELLENVVRGLQKFSSLGYKFGIVTNQSVINRGLSSVFEVNKVHSHLVEILNRGNIDIDFIYFCPHRPDESCMCRKPKIKLGLRALVKFNINPSLSYMIGDTMSDIEFGINLGLNTIQLKSGFPNSLRANYFARDLLDAADWVGQNAES